jgi:hypothetical protein
LESRVGLVESLKGKGDEIFQLVITHSLFSKERLVSR